MSEPIKHDWTDDPVCPHCGHTHSGEMWSDENEHECHECGKSFLAIRHVLMRWSTEVLKP